MSFYDEFAKIYAAEQQQAQNNGLLNFSRQAYATRAPVISGGGFLENFAASAIPSLTGAVAEYFGKQEAEEKQQKLAELLTGMPTGDMSAAADYFKQAGRPDLALPAMAAAQASQEKAAERQAEMDMKREMLGMEYGQRMDLERYKAGQQMALARQKAAASSASKQAQMDSLIRVLTGGQGGTTAPTLDGEGAPVAQGQQPQGPRFTPDEIQAALLDPDNAGKVLLGAQDRRLRQSREDRRDILDIERQATERLEGSEEYKAYVKARPHIETIDSILRDPNIDLATKGNMIVTHYAKSQLPNEALMTDDVRRILQDKGIPETLAGLKSYITGDGRFDQQFLESLARGAAASFQVTQDNFLARRNKEVERLTKYQELYPKLTPNRAISEYEPYQPKFLKGTGADAKEVSSGKKADSIEVNGRRYQIGQEVKLKDGRRGVITSTGEVRAL